MGARALRWVATLRTDLTSSAVLANMAILCLPHLQVDSTGDVCFIGRQPWGGVSPVQPFNRGQFYINGAPGHASVRPRTYNYPYNQAKDFVSPDPSCASLCMLIPLRGIAIYQADGSVLNLNPGDCNQAAYPDARRCGAPASLSGSRPYITARQQALHHCLAAAPASLPGSRPCITACTIQHPASQHCSFFTFE